MVLFGDLKLIKKTVAVNDSCALFEMLVCVGQYAVQALYHQVTSSGEDGRAHPGHFSLEPSEAEMHH